MNSKRIDTNHKSLFQTILFVVLISIIMSLILLFLTNSYFSLICRQRAGIVIFFVWVGFILNVWARFIAREYLPGIFTCLIVSVCAVVIGACLLIISALIFYFVFRLMLAADVVGACLSLGIIIIAGIIYWLFAVILQKYAIK
jgi:hypothetical protein